MKENMTMLSCQVTKDEKLKFMTVSLGRGYHTISDYIRVLLTTDENAYFKEQMLKAELLKGN